MHSLVLDPRARPATPGRPGARQGVRRPAAASREPGGRSAAASRTTRVALGWAARRRARRRPLPAPGGAGPLAPAGLPVRYEIVHELGQGAMATVHLARDRARGDMVALKLARPELAGTVQVDRFRREIAIAARLRHPNLLPVLDAGLVPSPHDRAPGGRAGGRQGAEGGLPWYTMPHVDGGSLRDRLGRERQLAVGEAVRIARDVAAALEYAHGQGVLHRDVKPGNIMLGRDGSVKLADFGMALALDAAADGDATLTEAGHAVGTPAYMSPEQACGERDLDARSDVYSLGCVLYEMLAGRPPFTGPTRHAVVARRFAMAPSPVGTYRDDVPAALAAVVERAMCRAPGGRYPTAAAFAAALATSMPSGAGGAGGPGGAGRQPVGAGRTPRAGRASAILLVTTATLLALGAGDGPRAAAATDSLAPRPHRGTRASPARDAREPGTSSPPLGTVRWTVARGVPRRGRVGPEPVQADGVPVPAVRRAGGMSAGGDAAFRALRAARSTAPPTAALTR